MIHDFLFNYVSEIYTYSYLFSLGKEKGDSLKNAAADFEGTEVHVCQFVHEASKSK